MKKLLDFFDINNINVEILKTLQCMAFSKKSNILEGAWS